MKLCFIVGTRPEVIKVAPLIIESQKRGIPFFIIHSNQHYSSNMDEVFFKELNLPKPDYNLGVGSGKHSNQTGNIMIKMEPILEREKPDWVLVQGDTNTVLAGGLAASKLNIKVAHIEAGLRSYDRTMPEETNRIVTDHLSEICFAVTNKQKEILEKEGLPQKNIQVVGNTIVDSLQNILKKDSDILRRINENKDKYILATLHRSKNVDSQVNLQELISKLTFISQHFGLKVVWPVHPRTTKSIESFKIIVPDQLKLLSPLNYSDFVTLEKNAKIILTDSGGVQEEACILGTPCVTLRENTERPETVDVGANLVVGFQQEKIIEAMNHFLSMKNYEWENPFGDGTTAQKILNIISKKNKPLKNSSSKSYSINVIGLGYMGLPLATLLAQAGHQVHGVDINTQKIEQLQSGKCPFEEPGLPEILKSSFQSQKLTVSTQPNEAKIHIISVPTPHKNKSCDLSYVMNACESLLPIIKDEDLVIIESTIKPTTCSHFVAPLFAKSGKKILIAHCPERAIPGLTLHELQSNDRIVGGLCDKSTDLAAKLYESFVKGQVFQTSATTAETCKLLENTFRDVNIALANEFDVILTELGVNSREAIHLANRHPRVNILNPGIGVGGHCIAIDPWFLVESVSAPAELIKMARNINDHRPNIISERIKNKIKANKKIGILGVSYKKNIGDVRETPALPIIENLTKSNYQVKFYDPLIEGDFNAERCHSSQELLDWADFVIELVDHDIFKDIKNKFTYFDL